MNRRQFVTASAAVAGTAVMGKAFADEHKHHKHHGKKVEIKSTLSNGQQRKLVDSTADCIKAGQACLAHCARELATGSTMMAACNASIQNMLAATKALNQIASLNSMDKASLKAFVKGCKAVCQDCHDECKKHASHHDECKACMEACKECIKVCDSIA